MEISDEITVIGNTLRLSESELLHSFDKFDPSDWTIVTHSPKWMVEPDRITGGGPDEPHHGQIFFKEPLGLTYLAHFLTNCICIAQYLI